MSGGAMRLWSWMLVAAMLAVAVWPRLPIACGCADGPTPVVAASGHAVGDGCCGGGVGHEVGGSGPAAPVDDAPQAPCDDEHGCSCTRACCGAVRPVLTPGGVGLPGFAMIEAVEHVTAPVLACPAPGFQGDLFRPPRA
jgi:hypothetical protein